MLVSPVIPGGETGKMANVGEGTSSGISSSGSMRRRFSDTITDSDMAELSPELAPGDKRRRTDSPPIGWFKCSSTWT